MWSSQTLQVTTIICTSIDLMVVDLSDAQGDHGALVLQSGWQESSSC